MFKFVGNAFQNRNLILATYFVACVVLLVPIYLNDFLPLTDLYNHAARHYVASVGNSDPFISEYYDYNFRWFGNSGSDAFREMLGNRLSPYVLVRVTIGFYMVNLVLSVCVLSRLIHGRWRLWPLASALLVFNGNFQWGFENFLFGAPFVIYSVAVMIASEGKSLLLRFVIISALAGALCIIHIILCAIFAFVVLGYELQNVFALPRGRRLSYFARHATLSIPFILSLAAFLAAQSAAEQLDGSYSSFGRFIVRMEVFTSISARSFVDIFLNSESWERGIGVFFALIVMLPARKTGLRLKIDSRLKGVLISLLLLSLFAPSWIDGVAFIHFRTPFILASIFVAATSFEGLSRHSRSAVFIALVIGAIFLGRVYSFNEDAKNYSKSTNELIELLQDMPKGSRLMPVTSYAAGNYLEGDNYWRFYHIACIAVIERQALVPILFQGIQGLSNAKNWDGYSTPIAGPIQVEHMSYGLDEKRYIFEELDEFRYENTIELYYENYESKFTHILALNDEAASYLESVPHLPLRKVKTIGDFTLYENPRLVYRPD